MADVEGRSTSDDEVPTAEAAPPSSPSPVSSSTVPSSPVPAEHVVRPTDMAPSEHVVPPVATEPSPPEPQRLHPLSPVLELFDRSLLAPGVIALGSGGIRILFAVLVAMFLFQLLAWSRRTWSLDGEVLRMRSGVLARNEQLVPCDRIQQVNLVQKLRHRLVGVASLRVEVAGGGRGSGVELDVLGHQEASELRAALLAAKAEATGVAPAPLDGTVFADGTAAEGAAAEGAAAEGAAADDGGVGETASGTPRWVPTAWPVVRLTPRQLVIAGLTGSELLVLFAFAASATQLAGDAPAFARSLVGRVELDVAGPLVTVLAFLAFLVVWLGSAVATSVLRDAGFALDLVGDELHLSRGLLDRKEAVLPLARVQVVQITASPLRRPLGYVSVRVRSASAGTEQEDRRVSIPILPVGEVPDVLELLLPGSAALPPLEPAPLVARRRAITRSAVPVAVVAAAVTVLAWPVGAVSTVALLPAMWFGVLTYRGLGHAVGPVHLVSRSGAIVRRTIIVPLVRAQSTRVRSSFFQRRQGLATCLVDVAGPGRRPAVVDVRMATAGGVSERVVGAVGGPVASPR